MTGNILLAALVLFVVVFVAISAKRGFAKMLISFCSVGITVVVLLILAPIGKNFLIEHTQLDEKLSESICEKLEEKRDQPVDETLDEMAVPSGIKNLIGGIIDAVADRETQNKAIADYLTNLIISALVYLVGFILIFIAVTIAGHGLDLVTKLPVIHEANGLLGGLIGLVEAVIFVGVFFLLLTAISGTALGAKLLAAVNENKILTWLYDNNLLLTLVKLVTGSVKDFIQNR